ncbi:MAG: hypothetical protein ACK4V1_10635 [Burkholderiaceae bacterium]
MAIPFAALSMAAYADGGNVAVRAYDSSARADAGLTRAQVRAERDAALARGELRWFGEASPGPLADAQPSTRTRAEVRAELLEAIRLGVHGDGGEAGPPILTPAQQAQIAAAGRAAAKAYAAAAK